MAPWFGRKGAPGAASDEEFEGGADRAPAPFDLARGRARWQESLSRLARPGASSPWGPGLAEPSHPSPPGGAGPRAPLANAPDLALPAFSLVRGGDLFEAPRGARRARTPPDLLDAYAGQQLQLVGPRPPADVRDAAVQGVLRVLAGNPALARRMLLVRPVRLVVIPPGHDFRQHGFPPHTNPRAAGVFWNGPQDEHALLGLREERVLAKPWLMVHEMTHAVHLLAFTPKEREDIDRMLMPVYRSQRWVEEALAIYAERAFGARYDEDDLNAPGLYGKTRRDWDPQHVFSLFVAELFRPSSSPPSSI